MSSRLQETTRRYNFSGGQILTLAGVAVRSTVITEQEILVHSSVRAWIKVGDSSVVATVGAGSLPIAADEKFHLQLGPMGSSNYISIIQDSAGGTVAVVPISL
jgi:hypothetical protein